MDGRPTGQNGECRGAAVFHIASGRLDDTDLSGLDFAFCNFFPSNLTAGNWKVGIVVDNGANAMFGFAPEFLIGKGQGGSDLFGLDYRSVYAESADYTFSSEMAEGAPKGRA